MRKPDAAIYGVYLRCTLASVSACIYRYNGLSLDDWPYSLWLAVTYLPLVVMNAPVFLDIWNSQKLLERHDPSFYKSCLIWFKMRLVELNNNQFHPILVTLFFVPQWPKYSITSSCLELRVSMFRHISGASLISTSASNTFLWGAWNIHQYHDNKRNKPTWTDSSNYSAKTHISGLLLCTYCWNIFHRLFGEMRWIEVSFCYKQCIYTRSSLYC